MTEENLWIGWKINEKNEVTKEKFEIEPNLLRRHMGIFGSTGSGKTVLGKIVLEEAALHGIPVIALDPQGDIASLILPGDPKKLEKKGVPPKRLEDYLKKVKVRIYTPASTKGLQMSINPVKLPDKKADPDDAIRLMDNSARTLVGVLMKLGGLPKSNQTKAIAVIYEVIRNAWKKGVDIKDLNSLADLIMSDEETLGVDLGKYMKPSERERLSLAIRSLTVGTAELLFSDEGQFDFNDLLKPVDGKTPINVIFLKTLRSEEEKQFFIAIFLNELYSWMLRQGFSKNPRMILFADEVAPFIPSGMAKPGPKEAFLLIFRQARKYGVECIVATQSPKDIDYKAFEQFNTIASGRITSEQSLKVLERIIEPIVGEVGTDDIIDKITKTRTGKFVIVNPELPNRVVRINTRWLLTNHTTLTEKDVVKIMAEEQKRLELQKKLEAERLRKQKEEEERRKREEQKRLERERLERERQKRLEEERRRKEEERRRREAELRKLREKYKYAKDNEKVFIRKGESKPAVSYEDIMNAFVNKISKVAKTRYGLPFLKELVTDKELIYEKALTYYYSETKAAIKNGLAHVEVKEIEKDGKKKKVKVLVYDFEKLLDAVLKQMKIAQPEYVDPERLKKMFEKLVMTSQKTNLLERILLGEPFLKYKI